MPIQLASAALMLVSADWAESRLKEADIVSITVLFFVLVLLAATQDIAVDGWALTLLSRKNIGCTGFQPCLPTISLPAPRVPSTPIPSVTTSLSVEQALQPRHLSTLCAMVMGDGCWALMLSPAGQLLRRWVRSGTSQTCMQHSLTSGQYCRYASTCQTVGMNIGYFTSFTVFLALNDVDFCNAYLRSSPSEDGHLTLSTYLRAWGWAYAVVTLLVAAFKKEVNFSPAGDNTVSLRVSARDKGSEGATSQCGKKQKGIYTGMHGFKRALCGHVLGSRGEGHCCTGLWLSEYSIDVVICNSLLRAPACLQRRWTAFMRSWTVRIGGGESWIRTHSCGVWCGCQP